MRVFHIHGRDFLTRFHLAETLPVLHAFGGSTWPGMAPTALRRERRGGQTWQTPGLYSSMRAGSAVQDLPRVIRFFHRAAPVLTPRPGCRSRAWRPWIGDEGDDGTLLPNGCSNGCSAKPAFSICACRSPYGMASVPCIRLPARLSIVVLATRTAAAGRFPRGNPDRQGHSPRRGWIPNCCNACRDLH
jgi:hypothetical protein